MMQKTVAGHGKLGFICSWLTIPVQVFGANTFKTNEKFVSPYKHYWTRMSKTQRQKLITEKIATAFAIPAYADDKGNNKSFYELVRKGYLTETQLITIEKLAMNAHKLELRIDDADLSEIVRARYAMKDTEQIKYDLDAYEQRYKEMVERTFKPTVSVKANGRFYSSMSNIPREFWDYVFFDKHQLSSVDIKTSHAVCLLALIKDIAVNYFGSQESHEDCLSNCQFSHQIAMIPNLLEHLRRSSMVYQGHRYFESKQRIPATRTERKKLMYRNFKKYTRAMFRIFQSTVHKFLYNLTNHENFGTVNK